MLISETSCLQAFCLKIAGMVFASLLYGCAQQSGLSLGDTGDAVLSLAQPEVHEACMGRCKKVMIYLWANPMTSIEELCSANVLIGRSRQEQEACFWKIESEFNARCSDICTKAPNSFAGDARQDAP